MAKKDQEWRKIKIKAKKKDGSTVMRTLGYIADLIGIPNSKKGQK